MEGLMTGYADNWRYPGWQGGNAECRDGIHIHAAVFGVDEQPVEPAFLSHQRDTRLAHGRGGQ